MSLSQDYRLASLLAHFSRTFFSLVCKYPWRSSGFICTLKWLGAFSVTQLWFSPRWTSLQTHAPFHNASFSGCTPSWKFSHDCSSPRHLAFRMSGINSSATGFYYPTRSDSRGTDSRTQQGLCSVPRPLHACVMSSTCYCSRCQLHSSCSRSIPANPHLYLVPDPTEQMQHIGWGD